MVLLRRKLSIYSKKITQFTYDQRVKQESVYSYLCEIIRIGNDSIEHNPQSYYNVSSLNNKTPSPKRGRRHGKKDDLSAVKPMVVYFKGVTRKTLQ